MTLSKSWLVVSLLTLAGANVSCAAASNFGAPAAVQAEGYSLFAQAWKWTDENNQPVTLSQWRGQPLVVTIFYRGCQLRCPRTFAKLKEIDETFTKKGVLAHFAAITIDPANDTPDHLKLFRERLGVPESRWHLLSGSISDTHSFAAALGYHVSYDDAHIDHDVRILFFDGEGKLKKSFHGWSFDENEALPHEALNEKGAPFQGAPL